MASTLPAVDRVTSFPARVWASFQLVPAATSPTRYAPFALCLLLFAVVGTFVMIMIRRAMEYRQASPCEPKDLVEEDAPPKISGSHLVIECTLSLAWPSLAEEFVYSALLFNALCLWKGTAWPGQAAYPSTSLWDPQGDLFFGWFITLVAYFVIQTAIVIKIRHPDPCAFLDGLLRCVECTPCLGCCCSSARDKLTYAGCLFWRSDFSAIQQPENSAIAAAFIVGGLATRWFATLLYYYAGCVVWPAVVARWLCVMLFRVGYGRYAQTAVVASEVDGSEDAGDSYCSGEVDSPPRLNVQAYGDVVDETAPTRSLL
tara:strand:+ start:780 stop:1724 length:945 start_codon:yes stop_codon:yes gene_type:complete